MSPSFAIDQNYEGGALPAHGVSVQFTNSTWLRDTPTSYPPAIANVDLVLSPAVR